MTLTSSVGFIGAGKMAEAIIKGVIASGVVLPESLFFYDPQPDRAAYVSSTYGVVRCSSNDEVAKRGGILVLAVKPQQLNETLSGMETAIRSSHLLISIAAGATLARIKSFLPNSPRVIRTMPNTPCLLGYGMTAIAPDEVCEPQDVQQAVEIFSALGKALVTTESKLDIITAISGSGPAYVYEIAEQFARAGQQHQLDYEEGLLLITQTLIGAAKMIEQSNKSTRELIDMVSSPGGTTVAGLAVLQNGQLAEVISKTVDAARSRSLELSKG